MATRMTKPDRSATMSLAEFGFRVLQVANREVMGNAEGVQRGLRRRPRSCDDLTPTPPLKGRGLARSSLANVANAAWIDRLA